MADKTELLSDRTHFQVVVVLGFLFGSLCGFVFVFGFCFVFFLLSAIVWHFLFACSSVSSALEGFKDYGEWRKICPGEK